MKNKRLVIILASAAILLLIPYIAMQFDAGVDWKSPDFVIMGFLLLGAGLLCELVMRKVKRIGTRIMICGITLLLFFLVWAELAVGIFGSSFSGS